MTKISVELDYETVDGIIQSQLVESWANLKQDLGAGNAVFVWGDQEADDAEIQRHIDALELVIKWYSTPDQLKALGLAAD